MVFHYKIKFNTELPDIGKVLECIQEIVLEHVFYDKDNYTLYRNNCKDKVYLYIGDNNDYVITCFEVNVNYLLGTTLNSLIRLGGIIDIELPSWTSESWDSVKDVFYKLPRKILYNTSEGF